MFWAIVVVTLLLEFVLWASTLVGLPGNWLMLITAVALDHWSGRDVYSTAVLAVAGGLALLGEILEFTVAASRTRGTGGSRRAAALSLVGSIVGGILGAPFGLLIGALVGACLGAFLGAVVGDLWAGRSHSAAVAAGRAAATGRLIGTIDKLGLGLAMWILLAVAAFV